MSRELRRSGDHNARGRRRGRHRGSPGRDRRRRSGAEFRPDLGRQHLHRRRDPARQAGRRRRGRRRHRRYGRHRQSGFCRLRRSRERRQRRSEGRTPGQGFRRRKRRRGLGRQPGPRRYQLLRAVQDGRHQELLRARAQEEPVAEGQDNSDLQHRRRRQSRGRIGSGRHVERSIGTELRPANGSQMAFYPTRRRQAGSSDLPVRLHCSG